MRPQTIIAGFSALAFSMAMAVPPPITARQAPTNTTCPGRNFKLFKPDMFTLYPSQPDLTRPMTHSFNVAQTNSSRNSREQLASFSALPSSAQNCSLHWGVAASRRFNVTGSGLVDVTQLTALPQGNITWNSVQPLLGTKIGSGDFTGWPAVNGTQEHTVGTLDCASVLAFRLKIDGEKNGTVKLTQGTEDGWYIGYDC